MQHIHICMHTHTPPFSFLLSSCCLLLQRLLCDHKNYQSCWISSFPFYIWTWDVIWLFFPQLFGQFASASLGASPTLWKALLYSGDEVDDCFSKVKKKPFSFPLWPWVCVLLQHPQHFSLSAEKMSVELSVERWSCSFMRDFISTIYTWQTYSWWGKWAGNLPASKTAGQAVPHVIPHWWQVPVGYLAGSEVHGCAWMHICIIINYTLNRGSLQLNILFSNGGAILFHLLEE